MRLSGFYFFSNMKPNEVMEHNNEETPIKTVNCENESCLCASS